MSRALALTQTLVILLSVLIFTVNPASADNHENNIIIDEIVEWANDQEVSGNIHITSQGELTISAVITFTSVSLIEIDEGGKLSLINNAEIISDKRASSLKTLGFTDENNRSKIMIPTSSYSEEMKIVIIAEEGALLNGSLVYVGDMDPLVMSGEVFSIDIHEGEQDTQLGFTGYGYFPIINSIILETTSGDVINEYKANDLPYQNMLLHGENGVTINSAGIIDISEGSIIKGLDISSSGEIKIKDSAIQDSCPIILTNDQASITMENTEISGSQDDYYVQL